MADDNVTKGILDLDNKEFIKKLKESSHLLDELGKTDSLDELGNTFIKIGTVAGIAGAAILAVKTALDLSKEAEHVHQVENSFAALSKSAGLAGDEIKDGIIKSSKGLADSTEILQAANKAIVEMGSSAKSLPETMELARKATVLFGGDLVQNFENINRAVASGNTRMLKQYGIVLDNDKALKDYAKSLHIGVQYLTDAEKRHALMNAALEKGKEAFKDVDESSLKTTNGLKQISVAFGDLREAAALAWDKIAGPTVGDAVGAVAKNLHTFGLEIKQAFVGGEAGAEATKELLEQQIPILQKQVEFYEKLNQPELAANVNKILKERLDSLHQINDADEKSMQLAEHKAQAGGGEKSTSDAEPLSEKLIEDRKKFYQQIHEMKEMALNESIKNAQSESEFDDLYTKKREEVDRNYILRKQALEKEGNDLGLVGTEQYNEGLKSLKIRHDAELLEMDDQVQNQRLAVLDNYEKHATGVYDSIARTAEAEGKRAALQLKNFQTTGKIVFNAFQNNAVGAFEALGEGTESAGEAMKGFMFGSLADIAEAHGKIMLLEAIENPAVGAEGAALLVLAGVLRGMSKKSKGSSLSGAGGGGGGSKSSASANSADEVDNKPKAKETTGKTLNVAFHGDYIDTDQSRTRFMNMLREAGDFTDFNLKQIGQK